jgi:hypothetical protein
VFDRRQSFGFAWACASPPRRAGPLTTHAVEITHQTWLGPLIRLGLGKLTREAAGNLK